MVKTIATEQKLEARFIKIRPQSWLGAPSLKLEFYGCDKGNNTVSIQILLDSIRLDRQTDRLTKRQTCICG